MVQGVLKEPPSGAQQVRYSILLSHCRPCKSQSSGPCTKCCCNLRPPCNRYLCSASRTSLPLQSVELKADTVLWLSSCPSSYPLAKKRHTDEYLRSKAHLRARTNTMGAVARIRNALALATHTFFTDRGFLYMHSPIVTASDCEGAGEMFQVGRKLSCRQRCRAWQLLQSRCGASSAACMNAWCTVGPAANPEHGGEQRWHEMRSRLSSSACTIIAPTPTVPPCTAASPAPHVMRNMCRSRHC